MTGWQGCVDIPAILVFGRTGAAQGMSQRYAAYTELAFKEFPSNSCCVGLLNTAGFNSQKVPPSDKKKISPGAEVSYTLFPDQGDNKSEEVGVPVISLDL